MVIEPENKILLAVLAHPDDETFGTGGTLAYYASLGAKVYLVCATRGEVGDVSEEMLEGYKSVGELREYELRCAAQHLGLAGVYFLNYRDSGMQGSPDNFHPNALAAADLEKVTRDVVDYIRLLKPQVVITFDPIGGYMHPDHIAIQRATEKAFHAAGNGELYPSVFPAHRPSKLYFHTFPRGFLKASLWFMKLTGKDPSKFGKNGDIDLVPIAKANFPIDAVINYRSVFEKKELATACHASQGGGRITTGIMGWFRKLFGISDQFMRSFPPPGRRREHDLFEGI